MVRIVVFLSASVIMFCDGASLFAETLSGSLTYAPSELDSVNGIKVVGQMWDDYSITFSWSVTNDDKTRQGYPWKYTYTVAYSGEGALQSAISHLIIECSEAMSIDDLAGLAGATIEDDIVMQKANAGNPHMPSDVWGIKFVPLAGSEFNMTWSFWCNREPVWGDFFIKGGNNVAYNYNLTDSVQTGFLSPDIDPLLPRSSDQNGLYHILRPDSQLPEPSAVVILITLAISVLARPRRWKKYFR
ncbi:MAG: hypothetical protein JW959_10330 [Pirellulales bacterium]|nr:hypothetical protein [Pirellulales bacterium]